MSKQWGHGYHTGKAAGFKQGKTKGSAEAALILLGIQAIAAVSNKTGLTDYVKEKAKKSDVDNKLKNIGK